MARTQVNVAWSSHAGVMAYNVYRRSTVGSYDFSSPLNAATPVAATTYSDTTGIDATETTPCAP